MSLLIIYTSTLNTYAIDIQIGIQDNSPVDIILTGGDTDFDYEGFSEKLTAELIAAGVAEERINIKASELKSFSSTDDGLTIMQNDWYCLPPSSNKPTLNGGELVGPSPKGFLICNEPDTSGYVEISMDFTWWCAVHIGGYSPRLTKKSNGDYAGYFISLEAPSEATQRPNDRFGSMLCPVLYRVDSFGLPFNIDYKPNGIGNSFSKGVMLARGAAVPTTGSNMPHTSRCVLDKNILYVWVDGALCLTYDLRDEGITYPTGTMGYGLSNSIHIGLSAVSFTMGGVTPLVDAVRSSSWQTSSSRFIVDVCDVEREDFQDPAKFGELAQRMQGNNAYYIGWGRTSLTNQEIPSKSSMELFIQRNGGNGKFFDNTNPNIYRDTANYIEPIVNNRQALNGRVYLYKDKDYLFTQD